MNRAPLLLAILSLAISCDSRREGGVPASSPGAQGWVPGLELRTGCTTNTEELCHNAIDDNCNGLIDESCGGTPGIVSIQIAWEDPGADIDLDVVDPTGELVGTTTRSGAGLLKERDCPADEACQGIGYERVLSTKGIPKAGRYLVTVRLERLGTLVPPLRVALGVQLGRKSFTDGLTLELPGDSRSFVFEL